MKTAIELARQAWNETGQGWVVADWFVDRQKSFERLDELVRADERARIAEQPAQQEPVAWMRKLFSPEIGEFFDYKDGAFANETDSEGWTSLYTSPPAQQEPVAYFETITGRIAVPDDTHRRKFPMCYRPLVFGDTSPQAQRKPLADEVIGRAFHAFHAHYALLPRKQAFKAGVRFAEAAHGIKEKTMDEGYYCVVCGKYIEAVDGVIVHDGIPHPDMAFDDEENPQ